MIIKYDINYLVQVVNDALSEEERYHVQTKDLPREYIPSMKPEVAHRWGELTERRSGAWNAVSVACKLLNVDRGRLVSVVKSMNRYERRERWQVCAYVTCDDSFRRFVSDDFEARYPYLYYQSTGRKMEGVEDHEK